MKIFKTIALQRNVLTIVKKPYGRGDKDSLAAITQYLPYHYCHEIKIKMA